MSKFDEIIDDYDKLVRTVCSFYLDDGSIMCLIMNIENLPHLLGLQYLSDINPIIRDFNDKQNDNVDAKTVMGDLMAAGVTFEELIRNKSFPYKIENRIREFTYENIIGLLRGITIYTSLFRF